MPPALVSGLTPPARRMDEPSPAGDRVRSLVQAIQAGTDYEASCEALYNLLQPRVKSFFSRRGFTADECADLTQQTWIRVFHGIGDFHHESRFERWLFEIAANTYRNELRRRHTAKRDALEEPIEELAQPQADERPGPRPSHRGLSSTAPDPLAGALGRERKARLLAAAGKLPPQMGGCLRLRIQGLKYREIADVMQIKIDTVKAHLHHAAKRLKLEVSGLSDDPLPLPRGRRGEGDA